MIRHSVSLTSLGYPMDVLYHDFWDFLNTLLDVLDLFWHSKK